MGESRPLRRSGVGFVVIGAGLLGLSTAWHLLRRARDVLARELARVRPCRLRIPGTWPDLPPGLRRPAVCRDGQAGPAGPAGTGGRRRRSSALAGGQESRSPAVVGSVGRQRGWGVAGGRRVAGGRCCGGTATQQPCGRSPVLRRDGDAATVWPVAGPKTSTLRGRCLPGRKGVEQNRLGWDRLCPGFAARRLTGARCGPKPTADFWRENGFAGRWRKGRLRPRCHPRREHQRKRRSPPPPFLQRSDP